MIKRLKWILPVAQGGLIILARYLSHHADTVTWSPLTDSILSMNYPVLLLIAPLGFVIERIFHYLQTPTWFSSYTATVILLSSAVVFWYFIGAQIEKSKCGMGLLWSKKKITRVPMGCVIFLAGVAALWFAWTEHNFRMVRVALPTQVGPAALISCAPGFVLCLWSVFLISFAIRLLRPRPPAAC